MMFFDLNIQVPHGSNLELFLNPIIERLFKHGYRGIAVTKEVDESIFDKSKKNKDSKKKISGNAEPNNLLPPPFDLSKLKNKFPKIHFYNRINIIISESGNIRKFTQCKNLKKFDLISFRPENQNVLKSLTGIAEVDIISYNPESKSNLSLNRKLYKMFVNQNVYFELLYAPAIIDSTARRNLIFLSHTYKAIGKSRNIIVSSGAQAAPYIRGPYDVINFYMPPKGKFHFFLILKSDYHWGGCRSGWSFGASRQYTPEALYASTHSKTEKSNLLFGLSEEQSKCSISRTCEKLLLRARKQRRNKATIEMIQKKQLNKTAMAIDSPKEDTEIFSK